MIPSSRIMDDAREKITEILEQPCDVCELEDNCDCKTRNIICPYQEKKADQILAVSGTTDIECPDEATGDPDFATKTRYKWKVSVVLENGEIPEPDILMYTHSNPSTYFISLQTQKSMLDAGYVQVVE